MSASIAVIGGGAAGMTAAIAAARRGAGVVLIDRNPQLGKKLLATGNGRCNLSNSELSSQHYHCEDGAFVERVLQRFGLAETLRFFASLGLYTGSEEGRIYPRSQQGATVRALLEQELVASGVRILTERNVTSLAEEAGHWRLGISGDGGERSLQVSAVILAVGGFAAPQFGSDGSAFAWLNEIGLPMTEPSPALVPLTLQLPGFKRLLGVRCPDCCIRLLVDGKRIEARRGELHWSKAAVSGIPLLDLSGKAVRALQAGKKAMLELDLLPELSEQELRPWTARIAAAEGSKRALLLAGLVREKLAVLLLDMAEAELHARKGKGERGRDNGEAMAEVLLRLLKGWRLPISGSLGFAEAQATCGGVAVSAIDARSMAVRNRSGLYLAGEMIDVVGDCGGYNLQWAWSSGWIAGNSAAESRGNAAKSGEGFKGKATV